MDLTGLKAASLADRIPTVSHRKMSKEHRAEVELGLGWVLNDPFYHSAAGTLGVGYHFDEAFGLRLRGSYFGATQRYPRVLAGKPQVLPTFERPLFDASLELEWAPFYGKWSLLGTTFQSFDAYFLLGVGTIATTAEISTWEIVAGFGQRVFWNPGLVWFWEFRGRGYEMERLLGTTSLEPFQMTLTFALGVMFYLPFEPEYGS